MRPVDFRDHRARRVSVEAAQRVCIEDSDISRTRERRAARHAYGPDRNRMADQFDVETEQEGAGHGTEGDPRRGLPRTGSLEHVAGFVETVLLHAHEIGMARTGTRQGGASPLGKTVDIHR